jgi:Asp-tRNA(Asn)/Glu-tRNA(Gln) amidotransferase A subunit family amidase
MSLRKKFTTGRLRELLPALASGEIPLGAVISEVIGAAQQLADSRAFLHFDAEALVRETTDQPRPVSAPLFGLPVSVKDLMDVAGVPTTCGSGFYAGVVGVPVSTAPFVAEFVHAGAVLVGKTHLNEFAYGITGENPFFGDCTIPGASGRLTGGSSSGAAASVVGGAACVALGTDTGGSLRVPAALCGLVSLRAPGWFPDHRGVFPLASGFDSLGWLQRYAGDVRTVAAALGRVPAQTSERASFRIGMLSGAILEGVDPVIIEAQRSLWALLEEAGCRVTSVDAAGWETAFDLFAPIQAREAFLVHQRWFPARADEYSAAVQARLRWGEGVTPEAYAELQRRRAELVRVMEQKFAEVDFLVLPGAPFPVLRAGEDHSANRGRIIRLTAPASLGNWPVLTAPWRTSEAISGIGFQLMAPRGGETQLVALADVLGRCLPGE